MPDIYYKPNLMIIGAQKSGTSWLHQRISQHPDIFMSRKKELQYFNGTADDNDPERLIAYYENFHDGAAYRYRGESTPNYFWTHVIYGSSDVKHNRLKIPDHIRHGIAINPRFILMLRHPVARAISAYFHHFRAGRFPFDMSILETIRRPFGVFDMGLYQNHWKIWRKSFERSQFKVVAFESVYKTGNDVVADIFDWLGLTPFPVRTNLETTNHKDNFGFRTEISDAGLRVSVSGRSDLLLKKYRIDPRQTPIIRHDEIAKLAMQYVDVISFAREEFGIQWSFDFSARDYISTTS